MAKIEVNKVELVWPGKYNADGTVKEVPRVRLPFQVIETVNESRGSREAKKTKGVGLFDVYDGKEGDTFEDGWKNKLIWGDNLLVMGSLLEKFAGKIDLIYIDPPFATGADFSFSTIIGESEQEVFKEQSAIEEKAYRDTWGRGTASYVTMMSERLRLLRELLSQGGSIYVHCDWHVSHLLRAVLDDAFGAGNFVNEIAWHYFGFKRKTAKNFPRKHDTILVYANGDDHIWNVQYKPHRPEYVARFKKDKDGRLYRDDVNPTGGGARTIYLDEVPGDIVDSVWDDIPPVNPMGAERWDFPTQKPEALLERIVKASSSEGSLVADLFCGSGTAFAVAEKLGRRWIGCDLGRWGIHVTRKRLLSTESCKPFEVLNLGKYERTYWAGVAFGARKQGGQMTVYEYLAFILKLYGAQPLSGTQHLHGKKGKAVVHVGAIDAPVTIDEVNAAIEECLAVKQKELHILGWEWEMGMSPYIVQEAQRRDVKLLLLTIPREVMEEQAVEKGDVRFFELAHVEVSLKKASERKLQVKLTDFAFPYADLIPEDVRDKITKWADYVDYWAIDWDFQDDTFMQGWVAYRTRKNRALALTSDVHEYARHASVNVMVKVVDIFGNDTTQLFPVEV